MLTPISLSRRLKSRKCERIWVDARAKSLPVSEGANDSRLAMKTAGCLGYLALLVAYAAVSPLAASAQVRPRHQEGLVHGFLVLRTLQGEAIADGDLIQNVQGTRVTSRLVFHFRDGSLHDETAVFSQHGRLRLLSDHLVQKGPAFAHPIDLSLDARTGQVTIRYSEDGKEEISHERLKIPPDICNGLIITILKNLSPDPGEVKLSYLAPIAKPKLVKLVVTSQGEDTFSTGGIRRNAMHFVVKVEIGGLSGALATLFGKQPSDTHVWILGGEAPVFVKSEGPLAVGGPVWRIELVSPSWPK